MPDGSRHPVDELAERYRIALEDFARADADAERLDELRKIVFSEIVNAQGDISNAKAEHIARADSRYRKVCEDLWLSRTQANLAKAKVKAMEMKWESWRTRAANKRAELQKLGA